jgi:hypothetical protein
MTKKEIHKNMLKIITIICFLLFTAGVRDLSAGYSLSATLAGGTHAQNLGMWVAGAGNLNGDTYNDVIIGSYGGNWETFILFGDDPVDSVPDIILPTSPLTLFSNGVSGVGDVNFDGFDDIIIGQEWSTYPYYIYFGGNPMDSTPDVTLVPSADSIGIFYGDQPVSGAGDVNNDGYNDVIIGNAKYNAYQGRVWIYYGGDPMDDVEDVVLAGENMDDYFGWCVRSAGDVNNDGFDDVIVGAYSYDFYIGRAYIYYGGDPMDNSPDVTLTGEGVANYFAFSVSSAGDVNYDGYDDVIVGAYSANVDGRAYIYHGGDPMDNTPDVILDAPENSGMFGYTVSSLGNADGDNYADVVVAAPMNPAPDPREKVFVYLGGDPMSTTPVQLIPGEGTENYHFGYSLDGIGDLDNNGYDDLIIGAYGFDNPGIRADEGKIYIYTNDGVVGIKLTSFTAKAGIDYINVSWRVESEDKKSEWRLFRKEGSSDMPFEKIASFPCSGSSPMKHRYLYKDTNIKSGTTYHYKLCAVDLDGRMTWYGPVSVAVTGTKPFLKVLPNPFRDKVNIEYCIGQRTEDIQLEIFDAAGRLVKNFILYPSSPLENASLTGQAFIFPANLEWDGNDNNGKILPSGIYYCKLTSGMNSETIKILLVK